MKIMLDQIPRLLRVKWQEGCKW